ncbi:twin-arginine translocation pathway signal protein [uncultured Tateyamaria sp.]|uniref:Acg family FMN-binding oxidoreductase n=1 Tax=uncultured Tateyamaria sp. TaxID=455651 RepID=UPI002622568B|nr:twin-arginine translocation pathway signal protein [uncultured Tateyamaria sp.]
MTLTRRKTLALIGGGTILAASGAAAGFVMTRTPRIALAPWDQAGSYDDPRLFALSYGLLAPNPHNRQPWAVELDGGDGFIVWRDKDLNLPVTDPFARQLTIGMGCFLDLTRMAAAERGFDMQTQLFPEGEDGPVAACRFVDGGVPDPLFAYVMDRRSHKEAFEPRKVTADAAAPLVDYAQLHLGGDSTERLRTLAHEAWLIEVATPAAWQESIDLLRIGKAEINANPDGIDAGGPFLEGLAAVGVFTREAASDVTNPGTRNAIEETASAILGAPGFVVQTTPGNSRIDQIAAGADWLRLNLAATGAGLALRPVSQALQEYAEVAGSFNAMQSEFANAGETVQMLGLLGYGAQTPRTPRWPLEAKRLDA